MSAFQQVAAAMVAALAVSPLSATNCQANPQRPWARELQQAVALRLIDAREIEAVACARRWDVTYEAECSARGASGSDPAAAVDALLSLVFERLAVQVSESTGAAGDPTDWAVAWDFEPADTPLATATVRFVVPVYTQMNSLAPATN